jgi:NAD+ kinase
MNRAPSALGIVVHPRRDVRRAVETLHEWSEAHGSQLVQIETPGQEQEVAPPGTVDGCDVVVALGGDGTTLAALHQAAPAGLPVLGVACGSLGALTAVTADRIEGALDAVGAGSWTRRVLPGLVIELRGERLTALNDLVLVRGAAGQVVVQVEIDGELLTRFAGDGVVASTPLGSTAYTLAAGGPMLAPGAEGMVLTPLAPHGGVIPPAVAGAASRVTIAFDPGYGGARVEVDGHVEAELDSREQVRLELSYEAEHATLISLGDAEPLLAGLRRRRILVDSPRVLARDDREHAASPDAATPASPG